MENYVGIDLGTTNSVISTYDKETFRTRVWKSPEQSDVTPSAIYIDRRGQKFVGQRAYNAISRSPDNCATLFKRFMGTTETIALLAVNRTLTPEECSAEILKTLFGYLPDAIRNSPDTGTVITVPAAFNQMQKNATMEAANMAGIGNVELVQEPVAAVMNYMCVRNTDRRFLVYNLGRGTFDAAIAESICGKVSLLAHGGIEFCGGRDFDRLIRDNVVLPYLHKRYNLPYDLSADPTFRKVVRVAERGCELAKLGLSSEIEYSIIVGDVDEEEPLLDLNGDEIYEDIPLHRDTFDKLIAEKINDTITCVRETMEKCGVNAKDLDCIVWVGGPTHYKPLRDKVSFELGIQGDILAVNPITAFAEGASIFAESIFRHREYPSTIDIKKRERIERRNRLLDTYVGMDLLRNPFYILNATQQDSRRKIIELAEKESLLSDTDKCMAARTELITPRKRVSAEVAWLPGVNLERVYDILLLLESLVGNCFVFDNTAPSAPVDSLATVLARVPYTEKSSIADEVLETLRLPKGELTEVSEFLGLRTLTPIARANLIAARLLRLPDDTPDVIAEWILAIVQTFESINPSEVQAILNVEREASGFPAITELSDITSAIQNCRRYYQQVIKFALDNIHAAKARAEVVMKVVESATDSDTNRWRILVEDTVDAYGESAAAFLETEEKNIQALDKRIRIAAEEGTSDPLFHSIVDELLQAVKDWYVMVQPVQLSKSRQGLRHNASHDVADRVRLLAIYLFNEYKVLDISQEILKTLKDVFTGIPAIAERITTDLEALNRKNSRTA